MTIIHITRNQLQAAIEKGIDAAFEHFTGAERVALRGVGRVAVEVGGSFNEPGCPLVQAGLWKHDGSGYIGCNEAACGGFYHAYDACFDSLRDGCPPSEVLLRVDA